MIKPDVRFVGGKFIFDSSIYDILGIDFNKQLLEINKIVHV